MLSFTVRGKCPEPARLDVCQEIFESFIFPNAGPFTVIQSGTPELAVLELKPQRPDQMQPATGVGAKTYDITGVRRYLRLVKYDMKHD